MAIPGPVATGSVVEHQGEFCFLCGTCMEAFFDDRLALFSRFSDNAGGKSGLEFVDQGDKHTLSVKPVSSAKTSMMNQRTVRLTPIEQGTQGDLPVQTK